MTTEVIEEFILPTIIELSNDKVANVRFNVAKTLSKLEAKFETDSFDTKV